MSLNYNSCALQGIPRPWLPPSVFHSLNSRSGPAEKLLSSIQTRHWMATHGYIKPEHNSLAVFYPCLHDLMRNRYKTSQLSTSLEHFGAESARGAKLLLTGHLGEARNCGRCQRLPPPATSQRAGLPAACLPSPTGPSPTCMENHIMPSWHGKDGCEPS